MSSPLPTRRQDVHATTYSGERIRLSFAIAKKLYRCPSCKGMIEVGREHVFVHYRDADAPLDHEHWHADCVRERLAREIASSALAPAPKPPRGRRPRRGRRG